MTSCKISPKEVTWSRQDARYANALSWSAWSNIRKALRLQDISCSPSKKFAINSGASGIRNSKFLQRKTVIQLTESNKLMQCIKVLKKQVGVQLLNKLLQNPKSSLPHSCHQTLFSSRRIYSTFHNLQNNFFKNQF